MDRNEYMQLLQSIWDARWGSENRSPIHESLTMLADTYDAEDDISEELEIIRTATKGEDLRIAIHDALYKLKKKSERGDGSGFFCSSNVIAVSKGLILPMDIVSAELPPLPEDCPFDIDRVYREYFVDTAISNIRIASATYAKLTDDYAVGMIVHITAGYTNPLFMSPIPEAVGYTHNSQPLGSFEFEDANGNTQTWYYSGAMYAQGGDHRSNSSGLKTISGNLFWSNDNYNTGQLALILTEFGISNRTGGD